VPLSDMEIVSSVTNLDNKGRKNYQVTKTISHEGYNASDLLINDIALIKVLQIPLLDALSFYLLSAAAAFVLCGAHHYSMMNASQSR
jgi:hypothetical protein